MRPTRVDTLHDQVTHTHTSCPNVLVSAHLSKVLLFDSIKSPKERGSRRRYCQIDSMVEVHPANERKSYGIGGAGNIRELTHAGTRSLPDSKQVLKRRSRRRL